jgi:hypothetical protein
VTIYELLNDFTELQDATGESKVFRAAHNAVSGFYVNVEEEEENVTTPLYNQGAIVTKLIDVTFRLKKENSNDSPVDDSEMVRFIKEKYEPSVLQINEDLSGKSVVHCFHVIYASSRYDVKEKSFKAYSRIRLTMNSVY